MRSMLKSVLVALIAVLALSTAIVATASASELKWEVKEGETWKVLGKESRKITVKQQGTQVFSPPKGYHSEIRCEKMEAKGDIYGEGTGEFYELKYTGCKVVVLPPLNQTCEWVSSPYEPNGTIRFAPNLPGVLAAKEGSISYDVQENTTAKEFGHIWIRTKESEESGKCGLFTKNATMYGSFLGKINNATSELEFAGEGALTFGGSVAVGVFGNDLLEVEGGGAIRVN